MKNILIGLLVVAVLVEGYMLWMKKSSPAKVAGAQTQMSPRPSGGPAGGRAPSPPLAKGDKLMGSAMEKYTHLIAPGPISADSQQYLTGFSVKTTALSDGSTQVDLVPKDSDDQFQSYVLKTGQSLYFVEMTPLDDKADTDVDANYRDDYGIVVDASGLVQ